MKGDGRKLSLGNVSISGDLPARGGRNHSAEAQRRDAHPPPPAPRERIRVLVRCRPFLPSDTHARYALKCDDRHNRVEIEGKAFTYDRVYRGSATQQQLFDSSAKPMLDLIFSGYNGTIFAYGQTGSGKTHTMFGDLEDLSDESAWGIAPRAVASIFERASQATEGLVSRHISVSMLEIYNEKVYDLLIKGSQLRQTELDVRENPDKVFYVPGLSEHVATDCEEMLTLIKRGTGNRKTGSTHRNVHSSRSHCVVTVRVEQSFRLSVSGSPPLSPILSPGGNAPRPRVVVAKLNLVDLAGSERSNAVVKHGRHRRTESQNINQSLSCLSHVMSALTRKRPHVPYRNSKLTRLLKDSLGGNTVTMMVACINPCAANRGETGSTLRYASSAKRIKNKPIVNTDPKMLRLNALQREVGALHRALNRKSRAQQRMMRMLRSMIEGKGGRLEEIVKGACDGSSASRLGARGELAKRAAPEGGSSGEEKEEQEDHKLMNHFEAGLNLLVRVASETAGAARVCSAQNGGSGWGAKGDVKERKGYGEVIEWGNRREGEEGAAGSQAQNALLKEMEVQNKRLFLTVQTATIKEKSLRSLIEQQQSEIEAFLTVVDQFQLPNF